MSSGYSQFVNEGADLQDVSADKGPFVQEQRQYQPYPQQTNDQQHAHELYPGTPYPQPTQGYGVQQPDMFGQVPPVPQIITHVTTTVPPNDYFGFSIFVMFCCFFPLGIVGLVKSNEVRNRAAMGDSAGAQQMSNEARRYSMIGLGIGIAKWVFIVVLSIVLTIDCSDGYC